MGRRRTTAQGTIVTHGATLATVAAFPPALGLWWLAAPAYDDVLHRTAALVLGPFQSLLDALAGGGAAGIDLRPALTGLPLATIHVDAVAAAALVAGALVAADRRCWPRVVMIGLGLALTHLAGVLFLVDWAYLRVLASRAGTRAPDARLLLTSVGYLAFCRIVPVAAPIVAWSIVAGRLPGTRLPPRSLLRRV